MTPAALEAVRQALFAQCILSGFLAALLWALAQRRRGEAFYRSWAIGWTAYAGYLAAAVGSVMLLSVSVIDPVASVARGVLRIVGTAAAGVHVAYLVHGVRQLRRRLPTPREHALVLAICVSLLLVCAMLSMQIADSRMSAAMRALPRLLLEIVAYGYCAVAFWQARERLGRDATVVLVVSMAGWALEQVLFASAASRTLAPLTGLTLEWLPAIGTEQGSRLSILDFFWLSSMTAGLMLTVLAAADRDRDELVRTTTAYRTLIESSPMAIVVVNRLARVQLANPAAQQLFGWAPEAVEQEAPEPSRESAATASPWTQALSGQRLVGLVGDVVSADGRIVTLSLAVAPLLGADGSVDGAIGVAADLTGQRRLEAELRHAQKMEAVGRLAGGIAHDFNNLLTAMLGSVHLLQDEIPPEHPAAEIVEEIRTAADRAADLTGRLLGFSRRERRAVAALDLDALVEELRKLLRRMVDEHVVIEVELAGQLPPVLADRSEIEQVVTNLCINARDAMQETGGVIVIRTSSFEVAFPLTGLLAPRAPGRFVRLDLSDTGIGMDDATLGRMFEPFYTTKRPGKGTGLGLATVYAILEEMGGQLRVESTPGAGTRFSLFLRAA